GRAGARAGSRGIRRAAPRGPRRARRAGLVAARRRARSRRGRSGAAAGGTRPARVEEGRVNAATQFLTPALRDDEEEVERSLRPRRLDEFVGQARVKEQLSIALEAAKGRGDALDHVL